MHFTRAEAKDDIHVFWGISYFTFRGLYTIFLTDVGQECQIENILKRKTQKFRQKIYKAG